MVSSILFTLLQFFLTHRIFLVFFNTYEAQKYLFQLEFIFLDIVHSFMSSKSIRKFFSFRFVIFFD